MSCADIDVVRGLRYRETHRNFFDVRDSGRITHIRVNMFPDGGIARVRVHGTMQRDWSTVGRTAVVDLAATTNGGQVLAVNDSHYGHHSNLIAPNRGVNMGDGWETRRRMDRCVPCRGATVWPPYGSVRMQFRRASSRSRLAWYAYSQAGCVEAQR